MKHDHKLFFNSLFAAGLLFALLFYGCKQKEKKLADGKVGISLNSLLKPTNAYVISSISTTTLSNEEISPEINALGVVAYDTRQVGVIAAWVSGWIDRLYVQYKYQQISKGQKVMDIYSPELMTLQENLLFLLKNDASNSAMINGSKERLRQLGVSEGQIASIMASHQLINSVTQYSNYSGHIYEAGAENVANAKITMSDNALVTDPLTIKEGTYVQKGQQVFSVYNTGKVWALLSIYADDQGMVKTGNLVHIISDVAPGEIIDGKIDFIEPFYGQDTKTMTVRVYFNNQKLSIPVGSQVKATIYSMKKTISSIPAASVVSLGVYQVVFKKVDNWFRAQKVSIGGTYKGRVQIVGGLSPTDKVAINAQFLIDSESFIQVKE